MTINPYSAPQASLPLTPPNQVELELVVRPDEIPAVLEEIKRSRRLPMYVAAALCFSGLVAMYLFVFPSAREWGFGLLMIFLCIRIWTIAYIKW
jgi:hypothetical protein